VIAGPGDMKDPLKDALTEDLRKRLLCAPFSISCNAGPQGLNQAAMRASHAARSHERKEADTLVQTFFEKMNALQMLSAMEKSRPCGPWRWELLILC